MEYSINRNKILQNIKPDDRLLASKVMDQAFFVIKNDQTVYMDFMNPNELHIAISVLNQVKKVCHRTYGGFDNAERKMLMLCLSESNSHEDFPIDILEIKNNRFSKIFTHRDVLGSIIGLGLDRGKLGDILLTGDSGFVFVHDSISEYIMANLEYVGKAKVKTSLCCDFNLYDVQKTETISVIVPSLRVDAVVSEIFKLSRNEASKLIKSDKLFINWIPIAKIDSKLSEGDIITLRKEGRARFLGLKGTTKKGNLIIEVEKF